jgi:hypothetical protein
VQLHRAREEFEAAGVPLVMIGQATPRHAAHFKRRFEVGYPVLADEERQTYKLIGAKVAGATKLLNPRSVGMGVLRTARSGGKVRQGKIIGNPAQLGASMAIARGGEVVWSHRASDASDNPSPEEILAAARKAADAS